MNENTSTVASTHVQLSPRASQQVASLTADEYARYEDALMELSFRLSTGPRPQSTGGEHLLDLEGCTLLYRLDAEQGGVLLRRVYCTRLRDTDEQHTDERRTVRPAA
jgi:hypothetical protein